MVDLKCRLCSSACALISLSGGKCRKNRDYIRKLVENTTGVKFEKNDLYRYICYPCTIQVYNFYIFKVRTLENEETLKGHIKKNVKTKSNKIEIPDLANIVLPSTNELQDTLAPWLISKSKDYELISSERDDGSKKITSEHNGIADNGNKTAISETEKEPGIDVSIQCQLPKNTTDKSTQIDQTSTSCDKFTQCMSSNISIHTQTKGTLTKSREVQCCLLKESRGKHNHSNKDFGMQLKPQGVDKETQYYTCENCKEIDCKCYIHNLVNVKQEPHLLATSVNLSPINSLIISPNKNTSPIPSPSTPVTYLRAIKDTSENAIYCKMCDKISYSKECYKLHKKSHMICSFCKKKFTSMKRTKYHMDNDCETKKIVDIPTVVQLIKVEDVEEVQKNYSKCLEDLKKIRRNIQPTIRMRSRSTSSADSFYSCCSFCRNSSVTVLHGLKIGLDKSVQTNLFDNQVVLGLVNGDMTFKSKFKNVEDLMSPAKKIKLSNPLIQ